MTMVNIPGLLFLYGTAVSVIYGLGGAGAWAVGYKWDRFRAERMGRNLVVATVGAFFGYTSIIVVWLVLIGWQGEYNPIINRFGIFIILSAPVLLLIPPIWAVFRYNSDDGSTDELSNTRPQG